MKRCNFCNKVKDYNDFYSNGYTPKGTKKYKPNCKLCDNKLKLDQFYKKVYLILNELGRNFECEICGYKKNLAALVFHHKNPSEKENEINKMKTASLIRLKEEIIKCVVLCSNCHAEEHNPHLEIVDDSD